MDESGWAVANSDVKAMVGKYSKLYSEYGYSPKSLDWAKGRQDIRFAALLGYFDCTNQRLLDVGCGFGDLNGVLTRRYGDSYSYLGLDMVEIFVAEAERRYGNERIHFRNLDFMRLESGHEFDIVVGSGIFNHKFSDTSNDEFIERAMRKAASICREGFAFDFLSDKVDFRLPHTWHASPEKVLEIAYSISRNVVLRNDYIPFEFSICVYLDERFDPDEVVFDRYKRMRAVRPEAWPSFGGIQ